MRNYWVRVLIKRLIHPITIFANRAVSWGLILGLAATCGLGLAQEGPRPPDRRKIRLKAGSFDPVEAVMRHSGLPRVKAYSRGVRGGHLIQFDRPIRRQDLASIEQAGGSIKGYVPMMTVEVVMDEQARKKVERLPGVRWVNVNQPSFKVSAKLMEKAASDPATTIRLQVNVYPGESGSAVAAIGAVGGRIQKQDQGRSFDILEIEIPAGQLEPLTQIPTVRHVEPAYSRKPANDRARFHAGLSAIADDTFSSGVDPSLDGQSGGFQVKYGHFDIALEQNHPDFASAQITFEPGSDTQDTATGHGTHTAASIIGDGSQSLGVPEIPPGSGAISANRWRGVTPEAALHHISFQSQYTDRQIFERESEEGAQISTNLWVYCEDTPFGCLAITDYNTNSAAWDEGVWDADDDEPGLQPLIVVFAAGNSGSGDTGGCDFTGDSIATPGNAKNVITVGATETDRGCSSDGNNVNDVAPFSSRGPVDPDSTGVGLFKPDVTNVGTWVLSAEAMNTGGTNQDSPSACSDTGPQYRYTSGTSMATPQTAGLAGVLLQDLVVNLGVAAPSPSLVKALLINGAVDLQPSGACYYSREREQFAIDPGWGRVDAEKSLYGPVGTPAERNIEFENEVSLNALATGESYSRQITVQRGAPLKITLVWTDYPAAPGAGSPLVVNDIDLEVSGPEGLYLGNAFAGDWSAPGGTPDRYNVVENVYIPNPADGTYTITVKGFQVVQDQEPDTPGINQNFSLLWSGNLGNCPSCTFPPVRDGAVTSVTAPASGTIGTQADISVDVQNEGTQQETLTVSLSDNVGGTIANNNQDVTVAAGAGAMLSFQWTPTEPGPHTLTAAVAALSGELDLGDNSRSSDSVSVLAGTPPPPGGGPELFSDDFSGTLANWTVVDEGATDAPSNWFIENGVLRQTSNIHDVDGPELPKLGTFLLAGDGAWADYTFSVWLSTTDDDAMGVMFRHQDSNNYYRFSIDSQRGYRRLVKNVGGVFTSLVEDSFSYQTGRWYHVQVGVSGSTIVIYIDGQLWNSVTDSDHTSGRIALYSWGNNGLSFDAVSVVEGADPNQPPAVTIDSPAEGSSANEGEIIAFAGTAIDPEEGDLTANLAWTSTIDGALGTGGSVLVALSAGVHTITASASDLGGLTGSDEITLIVQSAGGGTLLFSDDFSGTLAGWDAPVDEGTILAPSNWFIDSGVLNQTSNIYGGSGSGADLPKPGTFLPAGDAAWTDYTFSVRFKSTDNDAMGVMFRHQDNNNYYRFSMDSERGYRRLVKNVGGVFTLLTEDSFSYQLGQWYLVEVIASGGTMQIYIDGALWNTVNDTSLSAGSIALYSWGTEGLSFDDVRVTQGVILNEAPTVTISAPADGSTFNEGANISFVGSAVDNQDGDLTANLTWTSSIDGAIGSGGSFSAALSAGMHTITASVTDSGGLAGSDDISMTINAAPTVTITAPPNGSLFSEAETINFTGTASDPEEGDLGASLSWSSDINGAIGTGAAASTSLSPGVHTITASATDSAGLSENDQIMVTVQALAGGTVLFSDNFNADLSSWTVVDEGTTNAPSNWFTDNGVLIQTSNIYGGSTFAAGLPKPGTFLLAGDGAWTEYTFSVWLNSTDDDGLGVMFRHQDSNNHYRFSMDSQRGYRRLVKNVAGVFVSLAEDTFSYQPGQWYFVEVAVSGSTIQISIDGEIWDTVTDADLPSGRIALYSWGNDGLSFDVVTVVDGTSINLPPTVTINSPANGAFATEGNPVTFIGTADDPQEGDLTANLSWTSSINGALGTGGSVQASLSPGVHTITASVSDSGGESDNAEIVMTVEPIGGGSVLFSDDFSGTLAGWGAAVDEGTNNAPSNWFIENGVLRETSDIYGGSTSGADLPKPGTFFPTGNPAWTDYTFSAWFKNTDDDAVGVMFRYQDSSNYYRFSIDSQRGYRRLVKKVGGAFTALAEDAFAYQLGQWYNIQVVVSGDTILIYIDGALWNSVTDASLPAGGIALYSWGNVGLSFDDARVVEGTAAFNQPPVVTVNSPADDSSSNEGDSVTFAGTATDTEDGDLTAGLTWTSSIDGQFGTGGSAQASLSAGVHTITAAATDLGGLTGSDQITVTVNAIGGTPLFSDDFSGTLASWSVVDEGNKSAPSNWFIDNGVLRQTSNIYGGNTSAGSLPKPGTFIVAGDGAWTDYTFSVRLRNTDNDGVGVIFRHQDNNSYYRFSMDNQRSYRRLVKNVGGGFTVLAEDSVPFTLGQWHDLQVVVSGSTILIYIDGQLWNTVNDSSLPAGRIALYSWGSDGISFDDVVVE